MKKDLIFSPVMFGIGVLLFLLKSTGMLLHIVISVLGVLVLAAYTILSRKTWKIPALEIIARAFYGIALITGVIILNAREMIAVVIIHKASAALFVVGLIALLVHKLIVNKKEKALKE